MHTFFINTSGKKVENYFDIFEIQHETRRLVSLECPLTEWNDEKNGYKACVRKMGELIDSYKDINNDFNLIIYVDLLSYDEYTSIPMNKHRERYACLKALHSILKHYIKVTFVDEMNDWGRCPRETLLIFEENKPPKDGDDKTEDGKNLIRTYARAFLGIPAECEQIDKIVYNEDIAERGNISPEQFCEKIAGCGCSCLDEKVLYTYLDQIDTFISEAKSYSTSEQPTKQLLDRIIDKDDSAVFSVTFVTNRHAGMANKQEKTRRNLRLCFYIWSCIEDETIFDTYSLSTESNPRVKSFPEIDWDEVAKCLAVKKEVYQRKHTEAQQIPKSFSKEKLAPTLYSLYNERFALDEFGHKAKIFKIVDVEDQQKEDGAANDEDRKAKDEKESTNGSKKKKIANKNEKIVIVNDMRGRSFFSKEEYPMFDYCCDNFDDSILNSKATVDQYISTAQELRQHHLYYLQRLSAHVSDRLSNYAGRSAENDPVLLRKRKVSMADEDFEDYARDYRYAKPGRLEETKKLETVKKIAKAAYESSLQDYMSFCAGRAVALSDIEEQCNWFISRVYQIQESIKKLKLVAMGIFFAILLLYVPFVAIQFEEIVKDVLTLVTALGSIAIPIALLYLIFTVLAMVQRQKYNKAWKEFKKRSAEALKENGTAAVKYDQLLSVYVPTLRWVYEYKLDVDFYADCCKMANAKIGHHCDKLKNRVVTIGNIIEDLEVDRTKQEGFHANSQANDEIDYNVSFCSGEKNRKLYSIIDTNLLKSVYK